MLSFTGNLILWILCIIFRFFVIVGVGYGMYCFVKKIRSKINDEIDDRKWRNNKKKKQEAERLSNMTEEQIREEKQIDGELKFTIIICGIIILVILLIFLVRKY